VPLFRRFDDSRCSFFGIDSAIREVFHAYGATKKTAIRPNSNSREMVEKFPGCAGGSDSTFGRIFYLEQSPTTILGSTQQAQILPEEWLIE
jgi:hypothetical protein